MDALNTYLKNHFKKNIQLIFVFRLYDLIDWILKTIFLYIKYKNYKVKYAYKVCAAPYSKKYMFL